MKRRTFIGLAGFAAALGLPLAGKTAQNHILARSNSPISDGPPLKKQDRQVIIKVVGVGGAGINVVKHMIGHRAQDENFICFDARLRSSKTTNSTAPAFLRGLPGAHISGDPIMSKNRALSKRDHIEEMLKDAGMVFITAGMGGEYGTSVAPVVAAVTHKLGIPTVAVVNTPFAFEGKRVRWAQEGLIDLGQSVDALIVVSNEKVFKVTGGDATFFDIFRCADNVMRNVIIGISTNVRALGRAGVDFEHAHTVTGAIGKAITDLGTAITIGWVVDKEGNWLAFPLSEVVEIHASRKLLAI